MSAQTNDISERYLRKAIAEMNALGREIAEAAGPDRAPVLGSGHPRAEIFLLKHRPQTSEVHEGVAFFGRAGQAVLKSLQRLRVDPTAIYGTNCLKHEGAEKDEALGWLLRELHIVQPKLVVTMGEDARACLNAVRYLEKFGYSGEQAYLLLGSAPIEGRVSGIVDIPNACCSLYLPTAIFDFEVRPSASGPTKADRGQCAVTS